MAKVKSGSHLAAVRSWMQWNTPRGSYVTWGSTDDLGRPIYPRDLEEIAQVVNDASKRETREFIEKLMEDMVKLQGYIDAPNDGDNYMNAMLKVRFIIERLKHFVDPQF